MPTPPVLFADIGTVIQIGLVLLFILGPVLFRLFGIQERQPDRPPPKRQPQGPRPQPNQQPSSVDDEIEDFLRRARDQRGDRASADVEVVRPRPRPAGPHQPVHPQVDMVIMDAETVPDQRLESRLGSSIDTSDFEQRADRLGDHVEHADDAMEARLHATFDRDLGQLSEVNAPVTTAQVSPAPEEPADRSAEARPVPTAASRILDRLRTPQGMRDAIVLREILEPPEQRWSGE